MSSVGFSASSVEFTWKLFRSVSKGGENAILSPYSITAALMLAQLGAKGDTESQIRKAVGYGEHSSEEAQQLFSKLSNGLKNKSDQDTAGLIVTIANKLFARDGIVVVEKFKQASADLYASGIESMNFGGKPEECRSTINKWVEEHTQQKIKNLIPEGGITANTNLVLANAIYFKGKWDKPFKAEKTAKTDFHITGGNTVKVDMMKEKLDLMFIADESMKFSAVSVPYQGNTMSMVIIRPDDIEGLSTVESGLTTEKISETINNLRRGMKGKVDIGLPKFSFTKSLELSSVLATLGITDLFDVTKADLSGLVSGDSVAITDAIHKAFIEVNEEGTEAAAATAMISRMMMMPAHEVTFICDRPFLFLLVDLENSTVLFVGRYAVPE